MVSRLEDFKIRAAEMAAQERAQKSQAAQGEVADLTERHYDVGEKMMPAEQELENIAKKIKIQQEGLSGIIEELGSAEGDEEAKGLAAQNEALKKDYDDLLAELRETITESQSAIQGNEEEKTRIGAKIDALKQEEHKIAGRASEIMGVKEYPFARLWEYVTEKRQREHTQAQANYYGGFFVDNYLGGYLKDLEERGVKFSAEDILKRRPPEFETSLSIKEIMNDPATYNAFIENARKKFDELFPKLSDEIRQAIEQQGKLAITVLGEKKEEIGEVVLYEKGKFPDAKEASEDEELAGMSAEAKAIIAKAAGGEIKDLNEFKNEMRQSGMDKEVVAKMMAQAQEENKEIDEERKVENLLTLDEKNRELRQEGEKLKTEIEKDKKLQKLLAVYEKAQQTLAESNYTERIKKAEDSINNYQEKIADMENKLAGLEKNWRGKVKKKDKVKEATLMGQIAADRNYIETLEREKQSYEKTLAQRQTELLNAKTALLAANPDILDKDGLPTMDIYKIGDRERDNQSRLQNIQKESAENAKIANLWQEGKHLGLNLEEARFVVPFSKSNTAYPNILEQMASGARYIIDNSEVGIKNINLQRQERQTVLIDPRGQITIASPNGKANHTINRDLAAWAKFAGLDSKKLKQLLKTSINNSLPVQTRELTEIKFVD